jgi:hypothetical protein
MQVREDKCFYLCYIIKKIKITIRQIIKATKFHLTVGVEEWIVNALCYGSRISCLNLTFYTSDAVTIDSSMSTMR